MQNPAKVCEELDLSKVNYAVLHIYHINKVIAIFGTMFYPGELDEGCGGFKLPLIQSQVENIFNHAV